MTAAEILKPRKRRVRFLVPLDSVISFALVILVSLVSSAGADSFETTVRPFLKKFCVDCHTGSEPEGGISLTLHGDVTQNGNAKKWEKVYEQLTLSQMPPEDEAQPTDKLRLAVIHWAESELSKAGIAVENKLLRPGYGNYTSHQLLFGNNPIGPSFSPPRVWRIRPAIYDAGLQKVVKGNWPRPFTLKSGGNGFRDYDNQYVIAGPDLNQLMANAKRAAELLTESKNEKGKVYRGRYTPDQIFNLLYPEDQEPTKEKLSAAIDWLYHRVMLREPTVEEAERLVGFARSSMKSDGRLLGVRNLISAVLLSAEALYRKEIGAGLPDEHGRVMLAPRELAYGIAYALTDAPPDEQLLSTFSSISDQGATGNQTDVVPRGDRIRQIVETQVQRILSDPKTAKPRILGFFREYFEYGGAVDVFKDKDLFHSHDPKILVNDTDRLIMYFYERDQDVLRELLTTTKSFVQFDLDKGKPIKANSKGLGAHLSYSLPLDWKWVPDQPIDLPGRQRSGVLTQPAWLVAKSGNFDNDIVRRGKWVRQKLLGGTISDLPISVDAQLPDEPEQTLRRRMRVTREEYCWKCHRKMNPLGNVFEMYDHFGRWRTRELSKPVDAAGSIDRSGDPSIDGEAKDAVELIQRLAGSDRVRQVFVRHAFRYWMGRNETIDDAATLRRADRDYVESGGSMKTLIVSLLTSDSFLYRKN